MSSGEKGSLAGDFYSLLKSKDHCDVVFIVDGEELAAHKVVLSARSDVFNNMFTASIREKAVTRIVIGHVDKPVFEEFLRYLYTDQVSQLDDFAEDLNTLADEYNLPNLKQKCESHFISQLSISNCASFLLLADKLNMKWLKYKAYNFALSNYNGVQNTPEWADWRSQTYQQTGAKFIPPEKC